MTEPANTNTTPLQFADAILRQAVIDYCITAQTALDSPLVCASEIFTAVVQEMEVVVPVEVIRSAMLLGFEATHDKPMNFLEIGKALDAIKHIANARKTVESKTALIVKPDGTAA